MEALHPESLPLSAPTPSRWRPFVFWFAVAANLALFGLAAQVELAILFHSVELPPDPHPILREHARQPADHGYVFLLVVCLGNLVALARMRRRDDPRPLVHLWTLALLFVAPAVLGHGLVIGRLIARSGFGVLDSTTFYRESPARLWFALAIAGYFATLLALRVWKAWRPSWWQLALLFLPMLIIELAFAFPSVMELVETALYGPPPPDDATFGEAMDYYMEIGDPSEWMFPLLFVLWLALYLAGMLRRLMQIGDEYERARMG